MADPPGRVKRRPTVLYPEAGPWFALFPPRGVRIFSHVPVTTPTEQAYTVRHHYLLLLPAALAACKVEPTPRSFYKHGDPAVVELQESEGEIRTRVLNFVAAINRGDPDAAAEAMNPGEMLKVMGPEPDTLAGLGPQSLRTAAAAVPRPTNGVARAPDLRVEASQTMGWFATHVELLPTAADGGEPVRLRLSGVFARERGEWHLVQAHLSRLLPAADSVSPAEPPSPDSAAAPAAGG